MNWELIFEIIIALGIFRIIERILFFALENNIIKRNLEIREIATRVMKSASWLKIKSFEKPLPPEIIEQLHFDLTKIEDFDAEFATDIMKLINYPLIISFHANTTHEWETVKKYGDELYEIINRVNKRCSKLRYKPLITKQDLTPYFLAKRKKANG